jgi:integrase
MRPDRVQPLQALAPLRLAGLEPPGVHVLRHSAAKLRRDAGESVEEVSRFLDHSSLAVTTVYLRRLEGQADAGWAKVAEVRPTPCARGAAP